MAPPPPSLYTGHGNYKKFRALELEKISNRPPPSNIVVVIKPRFWGSLPITFTVSESSYDWPIWSSIKWVSRSQVRGMVPLWVSLSRVSAIAWRSLNRWSPGVSVNAEFPPVVAYRFRRGVIVSTSLSRFVCSPSVLQPCPISPYNTCSGSFSFCILTMWPTPLSWFLATICSTESEFAMSRTLLLDIRSCHLMPSTLRSCLWWNFSNGTWKNSEPLCYIDAVGETPNKATYESSYMVWDLETFRAILSI